MRNYLKEGFFLFLLFLFIWMYTLIWGKPFNIDHYFDRTIIKVVLGEPQLLSSIGIVDNSPIDFHSDDLSDYSDEKTFDLLNKALREQKTLLSYNYESLEANQKISYDIAEWILSMAQDAKNFQYHSYPVNQLSGIQNELPSFMDAIHQIINKKSANNYISRLSQFDRVIAQTLVKLKKRETLGIIPPRFVILKVMDQMKLFIEQPSEKNILFTSFKKKINSLVNINTPDKHKLETQVLDEIEKNVYPAYKSLLNYLKDLSIIATNDDGVWKLPSGDKFYKFMLKVNTTTDMGPEEIHLLGLAEVDRIKSEMLSILDSLGLKGSGVGELMKNLSRQDRFIFPDSDSGRDAIIEEYENIIREIDDGISPIFELRPKSKLEVSRIPEFKEKTAPGAYYRQPSMDGKRPGVFYANLRNVNDIPSFGMKTLAYHEAIPGDPYQLAIQLEMEDVPIFRRFSPFTAYIEGWALYAERVAAEYGFHTNPYTDLGRLQAELFRAVTLVVDTGIHFKRWNRETAVDYMSNNTGMPILEVTAEIERYIVWPGQACAYKIGMNKILELREEAKLKLGPRFNIKEFHTVVLQNGAVPLSLLDRLVDNYIEDTQRGD